MDTFVTPVTTGNALNSLHRYTLTEAGLNVALTDNLNAFSMIDCAFVIDGVETEDAKSVTFNANRNARAKGALRRKRGVSRHTPSISDLSFAVSLFHTSDAFKQKYFGQSVAQASHYGATCKIVYVDVSLEFETCPIAAGDLPYEFGVRFPKASIDADDNDVPGPDEIMEAVTLVPNFDAATGSDAILWLVNDMKLSDIMVPSSAISPVPANHVTTYTAP
jgi:hypothetical protein